jgi:hypothetical protein
MSRTVILEVETKAVSWQICQLWGLALPSPFLQYCLRTIPITLIDQPTFSFPGKTGEQTAQACVIVAVEKLKLRKLLGNTLR